MIDMFKQYSLTNVVDTGIVEEFLITPKYESGKLVGVMFEYFINGNLEYQTNLKADSERACNKLVKRQVEDINPELFRD